MSDIRKRVNKAGKTTYQLRFKSSEGPQVSYTYKTFDTAKQAKAYRENLKNIRTPLGVSTDIKTVPQAIKRWLDICAKEGTENHEPITAYTIKTYDYRAQIMLSYDWPVSLQEFQSHHTQAFKGWLLQFCVSRHQAKVVLTSFHSVMHEMMIRGIITTNPVAGISIKMDGRYKKKIEPPSEKEVLQILQAADELANNKMWRIAISWQRYRPILYMAADTGARPQEYLASARQNLGDVDIKIDRAIERSGHRISVTKTEAGWRWIDIDSEARDMATHYIEKHAVPNAYDLIFPTSNGRWQLVEHWRERGFKKAVERAGLVEAVEIDGELVEKAKYTPYDFRHFYASMLIDNQVNLKKIQTLLGHESITTTLNTYGHLIERAEAKAAKKYSGLKLLKR